MFNCNRGLVLPPAREQQQRPQSPGNDWLTSLSLRYLLDIHFQAGPPVFWGAPKPACSEPPHKMETESIDIWTLTQSEKPAAAAINKIMSYGRHLIEMQSTAGPRHFALSLMDETGRDNKRVSHLLTKETIDSNR